MREKGEATKWKASPARSNPHLVDSKWSASALLEIVASITRARKLSTERAFVYEAERPHLACK